MTTSGSVVGEPVLLLSFLASIDLFSSSLINVASVACAGLRPACRHPSGAGGFSIHPPTSEIPARRGQRLQRPQHLRIHDSACLVRLLRDIMGCSRIRSEEHTSELQSLR